MNEAVQMKAAAEGATSSVKDSEESDLGTQVRRDRRRSPRARATVRNSTRAVHLATGNCTHSGEEPL